MSSNFFPNFVLNIKKKIMYTARNHQSVAQAESFGQIIELAKSMALMGPVEVFFNRKKVRSIGKRTQ